MIALKLSAYQTRRSFKSICRFPSLSGVEFGASEEAEKMPAFGVEILLFGIVKCGVFVTLEICAVNTSFTCSVNENCFARLTCAT